MSARKQEAYTEELMEHHKNVKRTKEKNNLEKYLEELYEAELQFDTDEEVKFIQTGIEFLVKKIVDTVQRKAAYVIREEIDTFKNDNYALSLDEDKDSKETILKAGSFYEGSKNHFPDEFDFIFVLCTFRNRSAHSELCRTVHDLSNVTEKADTVVSGLRLKYYDHYFHYRKRMIYFTNTTRTGPALTLQFIYTKCMDTMYKTSIPIFVDLVPAFKIIDSEIRTNSQAICRLIPFRQEICSTGSFLVIRNISFTETDLNFMRNILSRRHLKIYRILKFLINGHNDNKDYRKVRIKMLPSSYLIKTAMIYHHYKCKAKASTDLASCMYEIILDLFASGSYRTLNLLNNDRGLRYPWLSDRYEKKQMKYFNFLFSSLRSIEDSECEYQYDKFHLQPLASQSFKSENKSPARKLWKSVLCCAKGNETKHI